MIAYSANNSFGKDIYAKNEHDVYGLTKNVLFPIQSDAVNFIGVIFLLIKETTKGSNLYSGYNVYGQNVFNNCTRIGFAYVENVSAYYAPLDS